MNKTKTTYQTNKIINNILRGVGWANCSPIVCSEMSPKIVEKLNK